MSHLLIVLGFLSAALHVNVTGNFSAGYYVNFHAYPYYPDFLKYPLDQWGVPWSESTGNAISDPYFLYLTQIRVRHSAFPHRPCGNPRPYPGCTCVRTDGVCGATPQEFFSMYPLMITEVGIPTSLGTSHSGYNNRWHGHMTEPDQAKHVIDMIDHMVRDGTPDREPRPARPGAGSRVVRTLVPVAKDVAVAVCPAVMA